MDGVTGIVLAGGHSRRFGTENKALATYDGETFIERVVSAVTEATDSEPLVAIRQSAQRERIAGASPSSEPSFVTDATGFDGPLAGVVAATDTASTPWLFVCGCDMPLLDSDAISWLGTHRDSGTDAVVMQTSGGREPLHAFYRRTAVRQVLASLPAQAGLQTLLGELDAVRTIAPERAPEGVAVSVSIENVNTKRELRSLPND